MENGKWKMEMEKMEKMGYLKSDLWELIYSFPKIENHYPDEH